MLNASLRIAAVVLPTGLIAPAAVLAQAPPMDISWAIQSQQRNWAIGQANANATAMAYRRSNAVGDYSMRAIRGCWHGVDAYGRTAYICP